MSAPNPAAPKQTTVDVVVELSRHQVPPTLPFELKDHVSPNSWETRVSALVRLASHYCRPALERAYLVTILLLTFLAPIGTYYVALQALENPTRTIDQQVWLSRFTAFGVMLGVWIVLSVPMFIWKYLGRARVTTLASQWTRLDALAAPSYGAAPVWRAIPPGWFRDVITLVVTVPLTNMSHFDHDSTLPPYIAATDGALPAYGAFNATQWSKDRQGGVKYGDLPIYTSDANAV